MSRLRRFWNSKIQGLPGLCILLIQRIFTFLIDRLTTVVVINNLQACGRNVKIMRGFQYRNPSNITIGNNVEIGRDVIFSTELPDGTVVIEDNVVIGRNCKIDFSGNLTIKKNSLLSEGVNIQTHDHGLDPRSIPTGKSLTIGANVWIGMNSTILSNAKLIGENSIIGANTVVTKLVESNCIYAGIPAKKIKFK